MLLYLVLKTNSDMDSKNRLKTMSRHSELFIVKTIGVTVHI